MFFDSILLLGVFERRSQDLHQTAKSKRQVQTPVSSQYTNIQLENKGQTETCMCSKSWGVVHETHSSSASIIQGVGMWSTNCKHYILHQKGESEASGVCMITGLHGRVQGFTLSPKALSRVDQSATREVTGSSTRYHLNKQLLASFESAGREARSR